MTAPVVAPDLAGDLDVLRDLVEVADTPEDFAVIRDNLSTVLAVLESDLPKRPGQARPAPVRAVAAAGVHLSRAGRDVPVELARRLAMGDLAEAVALLGVSHGAV